MIVLGGALAGCSGESLELPSETSRIALLPPHIYDSGDYEPLTYALPITNETSKTVRFDEEVRTSCGCTEAEIVDQELLPGEETIVRLTLRLDGVSGLRSVLIDLVPQAGDPWKYQVQVPAYPRVSCEPPSLFLGVVEPNVPIETRCIVSVHAASERELPKLDFIEFDPNTLSVETSPLGVEELSDGVVRRKFHLKLSLPPRRTAGSFRADLVPTFSDTSGLSRWRLPLAIVGSVKSIYKLVPARIFLAELGGEETITREIAISRLDGQAFGICEVHSPDPAITCRVVGDGRRRNHQVRVSVFPHKVERILWGEALVHTDDGPHSAIRIPVAAIR